MQIIGYIVISIILDFIWYLFSLVYFCLKNKLDEKYNYTLKKMSF